MTVGVFSVVEQSFSPADLILISAIALVCASVMRNYGSIILAVFIAALVDFMMPGAFALLAGTSVGDAMASSWARLSGYSGAALVLRLLVYFVTISLLFATKIAYGRR